MADRTIGELPVAPDLYDDSLLVVEQQQEARSIQGALIRRFAERATEESVQAAKDAAQTAAGSAGEARGYAQEAREAQAGAEAAQQAADTAMQGANVARLAIEDMGVEAVTLDPGNQVSVVKSVDESGAVTLTYYIPKGEPGRQGEPGPQGAQGGQGPPGPQGINGVAVAADGQYAFNVDENGDLILYYNEESAPDFYIGSDGNLYLNLKE